MQKKTASARILVEDKFHNVDSKHFESEKFSLNSFLMFLEMLGRLYFYSHS